MLFALAIVWLGLGFAYFSIYPVGFYVTSIAFAVFLAARLTRAIRTRARALMFAHDFVRNAYLAGTFIALACGITGWFVVLRGQLFAGDALTHVAFVGAIAAAVLGLDERVGLFVLTLAVAAGMAALGRRGQADDAVIGTVFAWILGIGVLLLAVLATSAAGGNGVAAAEHAVRLDLLAQPRAARAWPPRSASPSRSPSCSRCGPLLLSTLDAELRPSAGVPVRALGARRSSPLLAVVTAESTQAVGALLLLGLLAAPAGRRAPADRQPLQGSRAVGARSPCWPCGAGLALSYEIAVAAAEQRDHRPCRRGVRRRHAAHSRPRRQTA